MLKKFVASMVLGLSLLSNANAAIIETPVDLELQLLTDVSGSVDADEYLLQLNGYVNAFRSNTIIDAILNGAIGSIAVQYVEWSGSSQQQIQVDWTLINNQASAFAFADSLAGLTRAFGGSTAIGSALEFGAGLFANNGFKGTRRVVDVSGDGQNNAGISVALGKAAAFNAGVNTINGISIGTAGGLGDYYKQTVIGGSNAFHIHADSFADFNTGIQQKLQREISATSVSEPGSLLILALGMLGLAASRRRQLR
ncbi:DUF1194 domain-containing protein [Aliiglaciecola sp. CAU 1673]|uniref:DUF1194 domain-containing protein n=1 Tax=Aliiglaciecola sp. CAU 1673 TaxID=3032595 RepID=UPI0023DAAD84|nr:DUF1194 domain-containing protein [Aliiglaciecola sp. CAU 1673]MDF2178481.1 DUF1194 domain-containing protein [Aliiglaciecola sp. CAU 1673]